MWFWYFGELKFIPLRVIIFKNIIICILEKYDGACGATVLWVNKL